MVLYKSRIPAVCMTHFATSVSAFLSTSKVYHPTISVMVGVRKPATQHPPSRLFSHSSSPPTTSGNPLNDEDAWEKWEFGDEDSILDQSNQAEVFANLMEAGDVEKPSINGEYDVPMKDGSANYSEAYACLDPFLSEERRTKMLEAISCRTGNVRFIFEDPINLSNVWACLRTLDSFGIQNIDIITDTSNYRRGNANQKYRKMHSAMGTQKWLSVNQYHSSKECISKLKDDGWVILGTDLGPGAKDITEQLSIFKEIDKYAIVMGNEDRGISPEMRQMCDHRIYLPMRGFAQSFSLSVGCAAITSHLNTCNALKLGSLSNDDRSKVLYQWALKSVRGSRAILRREGFNIDLYPKKSSIAGYKTK